MPDTKQIAVRFDSRLVVRLDKHVKRLQSANVGMRVTRVDAIRVLLAEGLDRVEKGAPEKAKERRRV